MRNASKMQFWMGFQHLRQNCTPGPMKTVRNRCYFCMLAQRQAFCINHKIFWKTWVFTEILGFSGVSQNVAVPVNFRVVGTFKKPL